MQHAGGVGFFDSSFTLADTQDPIRFSDILAAQPHNFNGTRTRSYHAITRGWYINEIIKRVTPEEYTVDTWTKQYINNLYKEIEWQLKPYESCYSDRIAPTYRGPRLHRFYRKIARIIRKGKTGLSIMAALHDKSTPLYKTMRAVNRVLERSDVTQPAYRHHESPSYSGFTNAKSVSHTSKFN